MGARVAEIDEDAVAHVLGDKAVTSRLLRRSAPRNDGHLGCHCERSEAISMIAGLGTDYQVRTTSVKIPIYQYVGFDFLVLDEMW